MMDLSDSVSNATMAAEMARELAALAAVTTQENIIMAAKSARELVSYKLASAILDQCPFPAWCKVEMPEGYLLCYVNPAFEKFYSKKWVDLVNVPDEEIWGPEVAALSQEADRSVARGTQCYTQEWHSSAIGIIVDRRTISKWKVVCNAQTYVFGALIPRAGLGA